MEYIPKEQLECAANTYLKRYDSLPEFQGKRIYRIDPQIMAERVLGLKLAHHKLSLDMSILGFSTNTKDVGIQIYDYSDEVIFMMINPRTIVVDEGLKDINIGRYHFTIMHEVAHHIINQYFRGGRNSEPHYYRYADSKGDMEEWQADVLASYLLMPRGLVEHGMFLFEIDQRQLIGFKLPQTKERFALLSEFLGVSKEALKIRLTGLGYIKNIIVEPPDAEGA